MRRAWAFRFRPARQEDDLPFCAKAECCEDELDGERERIAMWLDERTGEVWICDRIAPYGGGPMDRKFWEEAEERDH